MPLPTTEEIRPVLIVEEVSAKKWARGVEAPEPVGCTPKGIAVTDDTSTHAARLSQASFSPWSPPIDRAGRPVCIGNLVFDIDTGDVGLVLLTAVDSVGYLRVASADGRLMLSSSPAAGLVVSDFPALSPASVLRLARQHGLPIDAVEPAPSYSDPGTIAVRRIAGDVVDTICDGKLPSAEAIDATTKQLGDLVTTILPLLGRASELASESLTFAECEIRITTHSLAEAMVFALTDLLAEVHRARASCAPRPKA